MLTSAAMSVTEVSWKPLCSNYRAAAATISCLRLRGRRCAAPSDIADPLLTERRSAQRHCYQSFEMR